MSIPVFLDGNNQDLEPVLEYLMSKEYAEIENNEKYIPTGKGREVLVRFMRRYQDYLKHYDIYCAVDLGEGEFAFEDYFEYDFTDDEDVEEWQSYLNEERWEDLRVAVSAFKKLNPVEIVFMSFLNEGRFGETDEGWQFDLLLGSVWDEILEICNSAVTVDELGYVAEDDRRIGGEDVIKDVITQGAELNMDLKKKEEELYGDGEEDGAEPGENGGGRVVEEVIIEEESYDVYESYYDPFYVSPCWGYLIFI